MDDAYEEIKANFTKRRTVKSFSQSAPNLSWKLHGKGRSKSVPAEPTAPAASNALPAKLSTHVILIRPAPKPIVRWTPAEESMLPMPEPLGPSGNMEVTEPEAESPPFQRLIGTPPNDKVAGSACRALLRGATFLSSDELRAKLRQVTSSLRDPGYGLRAFHDDMAACFPELRLYRGTGRVSTSGVTAVDEYKRTIGALFAVYWLLRIDLPNVAGSSGLDGQRGFSFGVDSQWAPPSAEDVVGSLDEHTDGQGPGAPLDKKRLAFFQAVDWEQLHQLMLDAGLLKVADAPAPESGSGARAGRIEVDYERTSAMLTLTAIHDVMKLVDLCPTVLPQHAPYHSHEAGARIIDHDAALAYVLEHDPEALPCFDALRAEQRRPVLFTQAQLGFNHGWLVQAEAPPGPLFNQMKQIVATGAASSSDIAFYFVHWLTDLAGALPTPLSGTEKFAAAFPHAVLKSFIRSFSCVQRLAVRSPTALMQEFLLEWWPAHLGLPPSGRTAIAEMRLVVQVQTAANQSAISAAFWLLPEEDREVLAVEMARSGCAPAADSRYALAPVEDGPAVLVYYSPAFLRNLTQDSPLEALRILAMVYRHARSIWPASAEAEGSSVTVFLDALKACASLDAALRAYTRGEFWVLAQRSDSEAVVEMRSLAKLQRYGDAACEVLPLWTVGPSTS